MTMNWIVQNAKYVIFTFGIMLVLGLVLMGPFNTDKNQVATYIGSVNGVPVSLESFRKELDQYQEQQRTSTGKAPDGLQLVKLRKDLFDYNVNAVILSQLVTDYGLNASGAEMWSHLENNPDPMIQQDSLFQTDGRFDRLKYLGWLHQEGTLDIPYVRYMESRMRSSIVPELQLKHLAGAQYIPTVLEQAYDLVQRKKKARLYYYRVPADSIAEENITVSDKEVETYFNAHPDSFYSEEPSAVLGYVKLDIRPSANDTLLARELVDDLSSRAADGASFEELAVSYSDDAASAENGGSLGDFQDGKDWAPEFRKAALSLDSGALSKPVLSPFGFHIIKCEATKTDTTGARLVKANHILIKIVPTPETVDSLEAYLDSLKKNISPGKTLKEFAKEMGLEYRTTKAFQKWDFSPTEGAYVQGLHSFAFGAGQAGQNISDVLQNDEGVYLAEHVTSYPPGRSLERSKDQIRKILLKQKKLEAAAAELEKHAGSLGSGDMPPVLGKAFLDSTKLISAASWVPGFGYNHPSLSEIFSQEKGVWGKVHTTDYAAVLAKIVEKEDFSMESAIAEVKISPAEPASYQADRLYQEWFKNLVKAAKVENNLDLVYRN